MAVSSRGRNGTLLAVCRGMSQSYVCHDNLTRTSHDVYQTSYPESTTMLAEIDSKVTSIIAVFICSVREMER